MKRRPKIIKASQLREHISRMIMEQGRDSWIPNNPRDLNRFIYDQEQNLNYFKDLMDNIARRIIKAESYDDLGAALEGFSKAAAHWKGIRRTMAKASEKSRAL